MQLDLPPVRRRIVIAGALIALEFALILVGLSMRGAALDRITVRDSLHVVIALVAGFSVLELVTTQLVNVRAYLRSGWAADDTGAFWARYVPRRVVNRFRDRADYYYQLLTSYLPRIQYLRLEIPLQSAQIAIALVAFVGYAVYYRLFVVLLAVPVIFGTAHLSARFLADQYREATQQIANEKEAAATWLKDYFRGNKEIELNWRQRADFDRRAGLRRWIPVRLARALRFHQRVVVRREFLIGLFEDGPYVIGVGMAIIAGAVQGLTIGEIYVLSTMITNINNANSQLQRRKTLIIEERSYRELATARLLDAEGAGGPVVPSGEPAPDGPVEVTLFDGTTVVVGGDPGIYQIVGRNGSGKSTLVDACCGYADEYDDQAAIAGLRDDVLGRTMVLGEEPVIFGYMDGVEALISGDAEAPPSRDQLVARIAGTAGAVLSPSLVGFWIDAIGHVEDKWTSYRQLSRGEKVILSCLRLLYHWQPSVRLLVVDECESSLQPSWQGPFLDTLRELAADRAVFFISHHTELGASAAAPQELSA